MAQNRSTAVMAQRREPHDSLDYFPTPPWATRGLCENLSLTHHLDQQRCWEPACGEGHMVRPLEEYFAEVLATDVHDYGAAFAGQRAVCDFLIDWDLPDERGYDWIITNPPFRLAEEFVRMALSLARIGCAVLVRTSFLEGKARYAHLFSQLQPTRILQFTERVGIFKGRLDPDGSTATAYCWIIWEHGDPLSTRFGWIAPGRPALEKPDDYAADPVAQEPMPLFGEVATA